LAFSIDRSTIKNSEDKIKQVTKEAIELADQQKVREAIIKLTEYPTKLYGVAVRVASAILTFYNPERYAVLDIHS
jgi:type II secretory pathway component PulF